ncbi:MAG: ABC transporter permease [Deltaproteobacteria bacterium]|nr:ABC transporter permease [Deltaproteobacteria bacterium]
MSESIPPPVSAADEIAAPFQKLLVRSRELLVEYAGDFGGFWNFTASTFFWMFRRPYRWPLLIEQMMTVGVGTTVIILLAGIFTGGVFTFQSLYAFRRFGGEDLVGSTVVISLARELGPAMTVLLFAGRSGSSMSTELATMRVTEQIDAMETMAVNPLQYLVVPRVIASTIMCPALDIIFVTTGWVGCFLTGTLREGLDPGALTTQTNYYLDPPDFAEGVIKSALYGMFVALISCYKGYTCSGGAKGVGQAATRAVVLSSVSMVILNYFVTELLHPFLYAQYNL